MTDENGSGKDGELDDLRWYVYPQECAHLLKEGVETVPGTDSSDVLGSIHPIGFYGVETEIEDVLAPIIDKVTSGGIAPLLLPLVNGEYNIERNISRRLQ